MPSSDRLHMTKDGGGIPKRSLFVRKEFSEEKQGYSIQCFIHVSQFIICFNVHSDFWKLLIQRSVGGSVTRINSPAIFTIACFAVFKMICTISESFCLICGQSIATAFFISFTKTSLNKVSFALIFCHPRRQFYVNSSFI